MKGILVPRPSLGPALERDLFALHARHFHCDARQFRRDLAEKDWVLVIRAESGDLAGFSTLRVDALRHDGAPITVVTSGDTITDPRIWGSPVLERSWIDAVRRIHASVGHGRLFWLLLTSGYRTYRFLPVFWREFFPRFDRPTPPEVRARMDALARRRYGACFDAASGIVRFPHPSVLRGELRDVPAARRLDPHVAFFLRANPGHGRGDELVCWTELAQENLTAAGRRMCGERA